MEMNHFSLNARACRMGVAKLWKIGKVFGKMTGVVLFTVQHTFQMNHSTASIVIWLCGSCNHPYSNIHIHTHIHAHTYIHTYTQSEPILQSILVNTWAKLCKFTHERYWSAKSPWKLWKMYLYSCLQSCIFIQI